MWKGKREYNGKPREGGREQLRKKRGGRVRPKRARIGKQIASCCRIFV